ncbi:hypothetical protein KFL_000720050 [Klebsormidium nitens]|uniref:Uncharacterized protein n=1 Tax=Klebsormidium nitens TaxID=105231 RepID=A0A1Y1HX94_KLENI|nr:hypothetical protein KFL_000720050 [Klebsormidium nitens]|eukprot:GAQ81136.1 hypothetical protein KFL_000720050 [Klebsormidium nitens]
MEPPLTSATISMSSDALTSADKPLVIIDDSHMLSWQSNDRNEREAYAKLRLFLDLACEGYCHLVLATEEDLEPANLSELLQRYEARSVTLEYLGEKEVKDYLRNATPWNDEMIGSVYEYFGGDMGEIGWIVGLHLRREAGLSESEIKEHLDERATRVRHRIYSALEGRIMTNEPDREMSLYSRDVMLDVLSQTAAQAPELASVIDGRVPSTDVWESVAEKLRGTKVLWRNADATYAFRSPLLRRAFVDLKTREEEE